MWLTSKLGIHPILNAVDRIRSGAKIPESGASEFRYLVRAYNKMYDAYQSSLKKLNFKATHDELTGVYNRAGYESIIAGIDLQSTYMILVDVDNFKGINDTYGHEVGDRILIKLTQSLTSHFRTDDFICRIGGDEFIVFMVHSNKRMRKLIAEKIKAINEELENTDDGLPKATISVGIVHGSDADEADELFKKTDKAMYQSKKKGKRGYTFSS